MRRRRAKSPTGSGPRITPEISVISLEDKVLVGMLNQRRKIVHRLHDRTLCLSESLLNLLRCLPIYPSYNNNNNMFLLGHYCFGVLP